MRLTVMLLLLCVHWQHAVGNLFRIRDNVKRAVRVATQYAPLLSSLSGRRSASRRRADRNVAVRSHSQYVPTLTAAAA